MSPAKSAPSTVASPPAGAEAKARATSAWRPKPERQATRGRRPARGRQGLLEARSRRERRSMREQRSMLIQQPASERRQALDRRRILQAALELVDEQGLEALSMRKLGAALGVEAMALYYYVPNKAALVQAVAELVLDQLEVPVDLGGDWADIIRALARSFRQLGRAHPKVYPLLATIGFTDAAAIRPAEVVLEGLRRAGLSLSDAFVAFVTLKSYVVGHTVWALG